MTGQYVRACAISDIGEGAVRTVEIDSRRFVVTRYQGAFYALDDICTHDGGSLGDGGAIDGEIVCPRHGARFDIKTGAATQMPAIVGIQAYEVKVENGDVYIGLGE